MNLKRNVTYLLLLASLSATAAQDVKILQFKHAGPVTIQKPVLADSLNVNGKPFEIGNLIKTSLPFGKMLQQAETLEADTSGYIKLSAVKGVNSLHLCSFYLNSDQYTKGTLEVSGTGRFEVYVNDKKLCEKSTTDSTFEKAGSASSELIMEPRRYEVVIKYLTTDIDPSEPFLKARFKTDSKAEVIASLKPDSRYTLNNIIEGKDFAGVSLSPNGKYALIKYTERFTGGKSRQYTHLTEVLTNKVLFTEDGSTKDARWMPVSNKLYYTATGMNGTELITLDPKTMEEVKLVESLPKGNFQFTPDERTLLFSIEEEGPKEDVNLIRAIEPSDRLPGWRNRSFIHRYVLATGLFEQLTYGHNSTYINDVSADSRYLLYSTSDRDLTSLPFSRNSLYKLDLQTMAVDTIWEKAPYISESTFSPDGKQLLVAGSGDAFEGIGLNIKEGQISNSYDGQLFIYDLAKKKAKQLTKEFNPNVMGGVWNQFDKQIYFLAEDQDYQRVFCCNPLTGKIKAIDASEDVVNSYSIALTSPVMLYYGQSVSNANRLYAYDLKSEKNRLLYDLSAEKLQDIAFGEVHDWNFISEEGTTIQGRYYLPPNFDKTKKYPMIVYYYGGTSPTNRALESRYSMHMYAAQGYVVYTLNPSGTTGFGQEFAARHVNAWGKVTADEIIKGTKQFCEEHSFVDVKKIGCIGASYGGFMTQYLQTQTDLFAAAISHAGISALSSYWGEGYWGYGYCSVANAGSYPWNNPELFTKQSPLFNADKIKTPLLLLHGNADTNVPIGESIQMFAALKLLGKTVEFIQIDGENHGIAAYSKRIGWQNSIFAWFAKYLKDEPSWWVTLYPDRTL